MLKLRIDGRPYLLPVPPEMPLLQAIQEHLHTISTNQNQQESRPMHGA